MLVRTMPCAGEGTALDGPIYVWQPTCVRPLSSESLRTSLALLLDIDHGLKRRISQLPSGARE